jgi:hypothetical protein
LNAQQLDLQLDLFRREMMHDGSCAEVQALLRSGALVRSRAVAAAVERLRIPPLPEPLDTPGGPTTTKPVAAWFESLD